MVRQLSRRNFLTAAVAAAASPLFLSSRVLGREGYVPPGEQLVFGHIGYGNRGRDVVGSFIGRGEVRYVASCDCYKKQLTELTNRINGHYKNNDCKAYDRYEDLLADEKIDVVSIATPDHWHTKISVEACKAGKDVFCEKPLTLTPLESRQIVAAARKYNRVCSSGSQRVMEDYGYMTPIVKSGALGEVKEAFFQVGGPPTDCYLPEQPIPEGFDWDRWLGPAPWYPYNADRCSGSYGGGWRRFWDYGNGFLADWGAHKLGGILYVLGIDHLEPVEILPPKCEANPEDRLTLVYPGGIRIHHVPGGHDITLVGSERTFRHQQDRAAIKPLGAVDVRRYAGGTGDITSDVLYCIRHRLRPFQDFFYGANTATGCQLANITYKVNRPLKWDSEKTTFNDEQADRFVNRPKRSPYIIND
ncbi:MAG: Gfo/Idh/MocA family oxidoreductase [Planctomycetaceae bacterium]|jgi:predicted dehydrogenase|nr:Gfo/Idh/MocA family oxidoreductase [Planctomycetaceae bacterium]